MNLDLNGRVAVVVGGARGLGRAIATAFAAEGADVAIIDREAADPLPAHSTRSVGHLADVTDFAAINRAAQAIRDEFGRVDHVVFGAGVGSGKLGFPFWKLDPGDWDRVLRVNLIGAANVAHAFAPGMAEAKTGTFLLIASVAGQIGSQTDPP